MDKQHKRREAIFYYSLKSNGHLIPLIEEDVDAFEELTKDIIIPSDLPDAFTILRNGYSRPSIRSKGDNVYSRNMAYAARNGENEELPEDIKEQMKRDKERAKKDI